MEDERREDPRSPSFEFVELIAREPSGIEKTLQLLTRDQSSSGIGGVYVGQDNVDAKDEYYLKVPYKPDRKLNFAWGKKVADYIYILGFAFADS